MSDVFDGSYPPSLFAGKASAMSNPYVDNPDVDPDDPTSPQSPPGHEDDPGKGREDAPGQNKPQNQPPGQNKPEVPPH